MTSTNTNAHVYMTAQADGSLRPLSEYDGEYVRERYDDGTRVRVRLSQPRTNSRPRLYWGVLREVLEHIPGRWETPEDLHDAVKLELGLLRAVPMLSGGTKYLTESTRFEKMGETEYRDFFDRAMIAIQRSTGLESSLLIAAAKAKL